jgi:hypothetical protein
MSTSLGASSRLYAPHGLSNRSVRGPPRSRDAHADVPGVQGHKGVLRATEGVRPTTTWRNRIAPPVSVHLAAYHSGSPRWADKAQCGFPRASRQPGEVSTERGAAQAARWRMVPQTWITPQASMSPWGHQPHFTQFPRCSRSIAVMNGRAGTPQNPPESPSEVATDCDLCAVAQPDRGPEESRFL